MRRGKIGRALAAVAVAGATTTAVVAGQATPAAAGSAWDCPMNRVCIWVDKDFNGSMYAFADRPNGACANVPPSFNDKMSSYHARTGHYIIFWADGGCRGRSVHIGSWRMDNIQTDPLHFNDTLSSISW